MGRIEELVVPDLIRDRWQSVTQLEAGRLAAVVHGELSPQEYLAIPDQVRDDVSINDHFSSIAWNLDDRTVRPLMATSFLQARSRLRQRWVIAHGVGRKVLRGGRLADSPYGCRHRRFMF
jgi:hypothetical protein